MGGNRPRHMLVGAGDRAGTGRLAYQAQGSVGLRRVVVVRQSVKRETALGKTLPLFTDDPVVSGWRSGDVVA
jgi:hypothetical protein